MIAQPILSPISNLPTEERVEIESDYIEVSLPSNFRFYDFKHLYIRPFKHRHIRKIIQGQENRNPRYIAEVLNSVVKCDKGYTDTVFRLCKKTTRICNTGNESIHSLICSTINRVNARILNILQK